MVTRPGVWSGKTAKSHSGKSATGVPENAGDRTIRIPISGSVP